MIQKISALKAPMIIETLRSNVKYLKEENVRLKKELKKEKKKLLVLQKRVVRKQADQSLWGKNYDEIEPYFYGSPSYNDKLADKIKEQQKQEEPAILEKLDMICDPKREASIEETIVFVNRLVPLPKRIREFITVK